MCTCNLRTCAILATLVWASAATVSSAADDWCPHGEFETNLAAIKHSFIKPDTRLEQTSLAVFGQAPAEISRIRSGVIWSVDGGPLGSVAYWKAYDADRHVFVLVDGGLELLPADSKADDCSGYRFKLRAGDRTYCMTIVAGTPDQARQFACRVNRLAADSVRAAAEAERQAEDAERRRKEEAAKFSADAAAEATKPGSVPQVLVLGSRVGTYEGHVPHCPCTRSGLLNDGAQIPWWSDPGDPGLMGWLEDRLASSDPRLWRVLHPPHVTDIAVDKQGGLYLLVDPSGRLGYRPNVLKLTSDGRSTAIFPRQIQKASEPFFASHVAVQEDSGFILSYEFGHRVFHIPGVTDTQPVATELTLATTAPITALNSSEPFDSMARGPDDNLYLALKSRILKRGPDGQLALFAGSETAGHADGVGAAASFSSAIRIAITPDRELVVADTGNNVVRRVSRDGIVTTIAGRAGLPGSSDGSGGKARFNEPKGIAVDSHGFIYVADTGNQTLRKITPDGLVRTLAGRAGSGGTRDGRSDARLDEPTIVAVDSAGTVYVANQVDNNIRRVSPRGVVTTLDAQRFVDGAATNGP